MVPGAIPKLSAPAAGALSMTGSHHSPALAVFDGTPDMECVEIRKGRNYGQLLMETVLQNR